MAIGPEGEMITAEMRINEVVAKYPQTIRVFFRHGMQCIGCYICGFHNIAEGAKQYGIELESLLNDLNDVIVDKDP
jgi:hybrid cluster-associated redox disulfide protein